MCVVLIYKTKKYGGLPPLYSSALSIYLCIELYLSIYLYLSKYCWRENAAKFLARYSLIPSVHRTLATETESKFEVDKTKARLFGEWDESVLAYLLQGK